MPVPHHLVFTGRMPFLLPSQQRQSTEGQLALCNLPFLGCINHPDAGIISWQ